MLDFIFLSHAFYEAFSSCSEIEKKPTRPYVRVCVNIGGTIFAVPLRSNISHPHVLWTDAANKCGLDFSKTVVVTDQSYIDKSRVPHIRQNEFDALRGKEYIIKQRLLKYIRDYKKAKSRQDVPRNRQLCQYSTLKYFEAYI